MANKKQKMHHNCLYFPEALVDKSKKQKQNKDLVEKRNLDFNNNIISVIKLFNLPVHRTDSWLIYAPKGGIF